MCGFAGIFQRHRPVAEQTIADMLDSIRHRGPDDLQYCRGDKAALGAVRLSMLEHGTAGQQPMSDASGRWVMAFNGEIFNHLSLRGRLPFRDWKGGSDTETLLYGWLSEGPAFLRDCDGFFSFVAWDRLGNRLYAARDRYGVKPLYVAQNEDCLWLASEQKAILRGGFRPVADAAALRHCIQRHWINGSHTVLQGLRRVLPGSFLSVDLDTLTVTTDTWHVPEQDIDRLLMATYATSTGGQLQHELRYLMEQAVEERLRAEAPVGTLCSGGLDSSLVTAMSAGVSGKGRPAFCATLPEFPDADEGHWAALVCAVTGAELVPVPVTRQLWQEHFASAVFHFEYPLVHESSVALSLIAGKARTMNIKALLTGEAADELFGGYGSRHLQERSLFASLQPAGSGQNVVAAAEPQAQGFAPNLHFEQQVRRQMEQAYGDEEPRRNGLEAALASDLYCFLPHGLNRLDKNMMQHSVEIREPFLANGLVKFALNLPLESRLMPELKGILRKFATGYLPRSIIQRPKVGFSFPAEAFFSSANPVSLQHGLLRDVAEIPSQQWSELMKQLNNRMHMRLWSAEAWCRLFIAGDTAETVTGTFWG